MIVYRYRYRTALRKSEILCTRDGSVPFGQRGR